jgi:hypothetical protein
METPHIWHSWSIAQKKIESHTDQESMKNEQIWPLMHKKLEKRIK